MFAHRYVVHPYEMSSDKEVFEESQRFERFSFIHVATESFGSNMQYSNRTAQIVLHNDRTAQ